MAALPALREARHGTALQPPAVVSGTQRGLSKPQVEDSKGRTKQGARGDNALLLHPCPSYLTVPFPWPHHAQPPHWTPGEKNVRREKHLKQTSSCPACDAVFLCERRRLFKGLGKQKLPHKAFALSTTAPAGCRPQAGARVAWRGALSSCGPAHWQAK